MIHDSAITGEVRTLTYAQLLERVAKFAGVLSGLGVGRGDRVVVYLPMITEAVVAMLACARIGAVHSVVFGGFAAPELAARLGAELDRSARAAAEEAPAGQERLL